jgi:hypothetical protein
MELRNIGSKVLDRAAILGARHYHVSVIPPVDEGSCCSVYEVVSVPGMHGNLRLGGAVQATRK